MKAIKMVLAGSVLAGTSLLTAGPAHACFNPDEPMCQIGRAFCRATEPAAKYRDKR